MSDQNSNTNSIEPDEYPAVVAQYQQWLANEQLTRAAMVVKLARAEGRLQFAEQDLAARTDERDRLLSEIEILRDAKGVQTGAELAE